MATHTVRLWWAIVLTASLTPSVAIAEPLYFEDFEQSDQALDVWESVWSSGPTSLGVDSGSFVITGSNATLITGDPAVANLSKTSVRARVAMEGPQSGGIGLLTNGDANALSAYQAGIDPDEGTLYLGWNSPERFHSFASGQTDIELLAGEEAILQFDVFGNKLSLWAWRPGESMPDEPQLTYIDDSIRLAAGPPGILFDNLTAPGQSSAMIREFQVANVSIPEPSSAAMGGIAAICVILAFRRRLSFRTGRVTTYRKIKI